MAFRIRAPMIVFLAAASGGLHWPLMAQRLTPEERAQHCNEIQAARDKAQHELEGVKNQIAVFYRDLGLMQAFHDNPQLRISFLDHQIAPIRERVQSIRGKPTTTSETEDIVELNTWTAMRMELTIRQTMDPTKDIGKDKNAYPDYLKKMQDNLTTRIGNLDRDARILSCSQQSASAAAPSNSSNNTGSSGSAAGTDPGGETVRVKVITTVSCSASDAGGNGLGNVTVEFHKLKLDGTLDSSSAPLTVTTAGDGTTPDSTPLRILPGSYTVQVGPEFGNLAWVILHIVQNPGNGDRYDYDAKTGGASVTFSGISDLRHPEEYQLGVRLTSSQACNR